MKFLVFILCLLALAYAENMAEYEEYEMKIPPPLALVTYRVAGSNMDYVPMLPFPDKPARYYLTIEARDPKVQVTIRSISHTLQEFLERMSRGRISITPRSGLSPIKKPPGYLYKLRLLLLPGEPSHVPIIGNAISAKHEIGHRDPFELGHANTRRFNDDGSVKRGGHEHDPFDPMTLQPGVPSLNAPHLHMLGWFGPTEEAYLKLGVQYTLRVINDGSSEFSSLKALTYIVPNTTRQVWFSYVVVDPKRRAWPSPPGMPGTGLIMHEIEGRETFLEAIFGLTPKKESRSGLFVKILSATKTTVTVKFT